MTELLEQAGGAAVLQETGQAALTTSVTFEGDEYEVTMKFKKTQ
jgi:hypothetical protein